MSDAPYEIVIGLEVHVQLKTNTKLFCRCSTMFGSPPNTQTCPVCLGMPGALPVMNKKAYFLGMKTALALHCGIPKFTKWDRKNYFYPDLPKGYQTSQFDLPMSEEGYLDIQSTKDEFEPRRVRIIRAHLEEDAGKSIHDEVAGKGDSRIDLNRTGTPLLEIVSYPDMRSAAEAKVYMQELRLLLTYLEVSDCNMQEGSLRADVNISVCKLGEYEKYKLSNDFSQLGTRCEVKNMNSIRFIQQAIEFESRRQIAIIEDGGKVEQETRLFDPEKNETRSMRSKEEAHDYRYFPCPDLLPLELDMAWIKEIETSLPELPDQKKDRFKNQYGINNYDANILTAEIDYANYFERVALNRDGKLAANWVINELFGRLNKESKSIEVSPISADALGSIIDLISRGQISGKIAKELFDIVWTEGGDPSKIIVERNMLQLSDTSEIKAAVESVISQNPTQVEKLNTNPKLLGWFVGQVMKLTEGKANPQKVNELLKEILKL